MTRLRSAATGDGDCAGTPGGRGTGSLMVATVADDGDVVEHLIRGLFLSLMQNNHAYDDVCNFKGIFTFRGSEHENRHDHKRPS